MRIEGQHGRLYEQRRLDSDHPAKDADKTNAAQKNTEAAAAHLSESSTQLLHKLRKVATTRPDEVQRVAENLRAGWYTTRESTQNTAAAILAFAENPR